MQKAIIFIALCALEKTLSTGNNRTGVPFPVTQGLRTDFPQLTNAAAIYGDNNVQVNVTAPDGSILKKFKEENGVFIAEPQFFRMFDFSLAEGNIANAISEPNTALVDKRCCFKIFWRLENGNRQNA